MSEDLQLVVHGSVVHRLGQKGLSGLQVRALDVPPTGAPIEVGVATSGAFGSFEITLDDAEARSLLQTGRGLAFRVFDGTTLLLDTPSGRWFPWQAGISVSLLIGEVAAEVSPEEGATPLIEGRVQYADGIATLGALVRLRHYANLGTEVQDLAAALTTDTGAFKLRYRLPTGDTKDSGEPLVRLIVEVAGEEAASSTLLKSLPTSLRVDVTVPGSSPTKPSAIATLVDKVTPLLGTRELRSLQSVEIGVLASTAKVSRSALQTAVAADKLAHTFSIAGETVGRPILHALLKRGVAEDPFAFALADEKTLRDAWGRATKDGDLDPTELPEINAFLAKSLKIGALKALGTVSEPTILRDALPATLTEPQRLAVAEVWIAKARERKLDELWTDLEAHTEFAAAPAELNNVRHTFQLGDLTAWNIPVVSKLRAVETTYEGLAGHKQEWWVARLTEIPNPSGWLPPASGTTEEKIEKFARELRKQVDESMPTAHMKRYAAENPNLSAGVKDFFENSTYSDFDIRYDRVEQYLSIKDPGGTVSAEDRETLKTLQRLSKVTKDNELLEVFEELGIGSAEAVRDMPEEEYRTRVLAVVSNPEPAQEARQSAVEAELMGLWVETQRETPATPSFGPTPIEVQSLFGQIGGCECDHCKSALSPSAYLVELAAYLKSAFVGAAGIDAWSIITQPAGSEDFRRKRREDLRSVPLSCTATQTPLPYIDLVNEVLERLMPVAAYGGPAGVYRQSTTAPVGSQLDPYAGDTPAPLPVLPLNPDASAGDLGAYPQDTWYPTYRLLSRRDFRASFALPFDRPTVEARLYLEDAGAPLSRLLCMTSAAGEDRFPAVPGWTRLGALEALGFTAAEADPFELFPMSTIDLQSAWTWGGAPDGRFAEDLGPSTDSRVRISGLMQRLGLGWDELKRVCGSAFVRRFSAAGPLVLPDDCNLSTVWLSPGKPIPSADGDPTDSAEDAFERRSRFLEGVHRFVRLQRRLGWSFEELDTALAIFAPNVSGSPARKTLDDAVWTALAETVELAREFRLRPIELLSLWSPTDNNPSNTSAIVAAMPEGSLWEQTFERRQARQPNDNLFKSIRDQGIVEEPASPGSPRVLTDIELRSLASAIDARHGDLSALSRTTGSGPITANRENIWRVWARARMARLTGLPIVDACWLFDALAPVGSSDDLLTPSGYLRLREILRFAGILRQARVPVADIAYLIGNDESARTRIRLDESRATTLLSSLRTELAAVVRQTAPFVRDGAPSEIAVEWLVPALARFMTNEAGQRVFSLLDTTDPLTSGTDTREPFLREVLGRILWNYELDELIAIPADASASVERRQYLVRRLIQLIALPENSVPGPSTPRPKDHPTDPSEQFASALLRQVLRAFERATLTSADIDAFTTRLRTGAALVLPADQVACDLAFGEGFYADLNGMPRTTPTEVEARTDAAVRMALLRQTFSRLPLPESAGSSATDYVLEALSALNRTATFIDASNLIAAEFLSPHVREPFWALLKTLDASSAEARELRREYVLVALGSMREPARSDELDAVRDTFRSLAEETWGSPLPESREWIVRSFREGLERGDLSGPPPIFTPVDLVALGLPAALGPEWSSGTSRPVDQRHNATAWRLRSMLLFRSRLRDLALPRRLRIILADGFGLTSEAADKLLGPGTLGVHEPGGVGLLVRERLLSPAFILSEGEIGFDDRRRVERIWKAAQVLGHLKLSDQELTQFGPWTSRGLIDVRSLPVSNAEVSSASLTSLVRGFLNALEAVSFRSLLRVEDRTAFDLLLAVASITGVPGDEAADAVHIRNIAAWTGWVDIHQPTNLDPFFSSTFLSSPASYVAVSRRIRRRVSAEQVTQTLEVPLPKILAWVEEFSLQVSPTGETFTGRLSLAQGVRQALRARHGDRAWIARSRPLVDRLREQQRDALAEYHRTARAMPDRNHLFGWLLVDTEMSCCMLTTRTLFATAALQTAIQRGFMGLEQGVTPRDGYARRWQWMKQYRVWEANRKVFLFPENWLDPSLRRDKSPLFKTFEETLQQSQLGESDITKALGTYLTGLDRISRLDVRALAFGPNAEGGEAQTPLHMVGRTMSTPHEYFYRRREPGHRWTAWEKLDLQIRSNSHALTFVDNRLHLFWIEVVSESDDPQASGSSDTRRILGDNAGAPNGRTKPDSGIAVRVSYSRLDNGVWSPARVSAETQRIEWSYDNRFHATFMQLENTHTPDRLGRNLILRVLPGEGERVAARVLVMQSCFRSPDDVDVHTNHRATFVLRRCTGELERLPHAPFQLPAGHVAHTGFPVHRTTTSGAEYYLVDDQLETWDVESIDVAFRVPSSYTPVMTVPVSGGASPGGRSAYQYRLTVDHCRVDNSEVHPALTSLRPVVLHDGLRSFLLELGRCGRCPDVLGGAISPPTGKALGAMLTTEAPGGAPNKVVVKPEPNTDVLSFEGISSEDHVSELGGVTYPTDTSAGNRSGGRVGNPSPVERVVASPLHHFYACRFLERLERGGAAELFHLNTQFPLPITERPSDHALLLTNLNDTYQFRGPVEDAPSDDLGFLPGDAYGLYNWEVFFHLPFRVACMLNEDQQFERAQSWFHYIFDPFVVEMTPPAELNGVSLGGAGSLRRCWRFRPFFLSETGAGANDLRAIVNPRDNGEAAVLARRRIAQQIAAWLENPFDPHAVAVFRQRAFQMAVVFRYIDNLLDWGDQLFRRDTRESVVEATQLYVLAAELLGRRPQRIRREGASGAATTLEAALAPPTSGLLTEDLAGGSGGACCHQLPSDAEEILAALGRWTGFCFPTNDKLSEHWDRVADRLFKIRHCLNIDGVLRELPLFEPPIDPELLVRAAAAGVDIGAALADAAPSLPTFRFQLLLQRAVEFTADLRNLGGQLLSALEKRDAEALARVRAEHDRSVLEATREVRKLQMEEADKQIDALTLSEKLAKNRAAYYAAKPHMNALETSALASQAVAMGLQIASQALSTGAAASGAAPDSALGGAGAMASPVAILLTGGGNISRSAANAGKALSIAGTIASTAASTLATLGSYEHRYDDWQFQHNVALQEAEQIKEQILAATVRKSIAVREYDNISRQIENARRIEEELRTKFTNTELYEWMVRQISLIYFRSYEMALDLARRAERAYRFERLDSNARFITPTYWDNLKRGLLAGERLHHDLRRMEKAFLETERRDHEITRHISLAQLAPEQLVFLRELGSCEIMVPESLFDRDHPGQYHRRVKSVTISIPAVIGPYGGVHARLTLLSSVIRRTAELPEGYESLRDLGERRDATQFAYDVVPTQSIVTSSGQSDSGMFQLDFRSEKVLPFEGAGAVSRWRLELDPLSQSFDTRTITDVILHMQYSARDGGATFAQAVRQALLATPENLTRHHTVSLAANAPDALHAFRTSVSSDSRSLALPRLRSLAGFVPRGMSGELLMLAGFLVMRSPHAVASPATKVFLRTGIAELGDPESPIVDAMEGRRLTPGGLFMFEGGFDSASIYDADDLRLEFEPIFPEGLGGDPMSNLIDVVLVLAEMLVPEL